MSATESRSFRPHARKREFPVYICSTFLDAHAERDHLRSSVYPAIRDSCVRRGVQFVDVELDLESAGSGPPGDGQVERRLDEILRRCPFVIGLVGGRYARPGGPHGESAEEVVQRMPWITDRLGDPRELAGIGVMEGLLANPFMRERGLFCIRSREAEIPRELTQDREAVERIDRLGGRLEAGSFQVRDGYTSPRMLGDWVREYLEKMLDRLYPEQAASQSERDRRLHETLAEELRRGYVPIPDYLDRLDAHAASDGAPLVVAGPSGAGKSSLLAYWTHRHAAAHPDAFIITHFAGASATRADHVGLLRRIMEEIRTRYHIDDEPPTERGRILAEFPDWLGRVGDERLILVIDAVDRLDGEAGLGWLPEYIPPCVRLVLSTSEPRQISIARGRDWEELEVRSLGHDARLGIARILLGRAGRAEEELVNRLAYDVANANPLLLRLKILEIGLFLSERRSDGIEELLRAADPSELYARVLARLESEFGREVICRVMTALRVSREGLTLDELSAASAAAMEPLMAICERIAWYVGTGGGRISFNHVSLVQAVEHRYAADADMEETIRRRLIELCDDDGSLASVTERLAQLHAVRDAARLEATLLSPEAVRTLLDGGHGFEIVDAWAELGKTESFDREYCDRLFAGLPAPLVDEDPELALQIALFLSDCSRHAAAGRIAARLIESGAISGGELKISSLMILGAACHAAGELGRADQYLREAVAESRALHGEDAPRTIAARQALAELLYISEGPKAAFEMFRQIAHVVRAEGGRVDAAYATAITNLGAALMKDSDRVSTGTARRLFEDALEIRRGLFAESTIMVASSLNNLASALERLDEFPAALPHMELSRRIHERLYGPGHYLTGRVTINLAVLLKRMNHVEKAERYFRLGIDVLKHAFSDIHQDVAGALGNYGSMLQSVHRYDEAGEKICEALRIRSRLLGRTGADTVNMALNLAGNFRMRGMHRDDAGRIDDLKTAVRLYRIAMPFRLEIFGWENDGTRRAVENYIATLEELGVPDARETVFRELGLS